MLSRAQELAALQAMLPPADLNRLAGYIQACGDTTKLIAFTRRPRRAGIRIAEVDLGNHGGDTVSGHCHPFGLPGCVAFAHHNAGGVHVSMAGIRSAGALCRR